MKDFKRARYGGYFKEKGSSLFIGLALMAILVPLALPVLIEINREPVSVDKPSVYSSALALAQAGVERAIREMNSGEIAYWQGDSRLKTLTLPSWQVPGSKETGDVEIRVKWLNEDNPVVEAIGRVSYTDSFKRGMTARFIVERKAGTVLKRDGYNWVSLFPQTPALSVVKGSM
ncbi:MAG: hypothetical protein OEY25_13410 [Candidatus Aminicenantes bacterium]|nr:hypothetical protein [Candidatus Aminicenantes bacterium]